MGYILTRPALNELPVTVVCRISDKTFIPFVQANVDCQRFLLDWKAGAQVLNADGSPAVYSDAAVIALGLTPPEDPQ